MARTHLVADTDPALTLCGLTIESPLWNGGRLLTLSALIDAEKPCRKCQRADDARYSTKPANRGAPKPDTPFVATLPGPASYGARAPSRAGRSALERALVAHDPPPRGWARPEDAVRAAVRARIERNHRGVPLRSSAEPSDRVQHARDPSLGGREHAEVDRYRNVELALDRAERSGRIGTGGDAPLSLAGMRWIYELAVAGKPIPKPTKRGKDELADQWTEWLVYSHEDVAREARERFRNEAITEWHVTLIRRAFTAFVGDALRASGEVGAAEPRRDA